MRGKIMFRRLCPAIWCPGVLWLLLGGFGTTLARAQGDGAVEGQAAVYLYTVGYDDRLPLKEISSRTVIDGPVARSRVTYVAANSYTAPIEAGFNLHVPKDTVLTGFGYYYGSRFIRGKMYDKDEAWQIYQTVISHGRDPGFMYRRTERDYHAQIFPVMALQDLRVVVDLVQVLSADREGYHFELPVTQNGGYSAPIPVHAEVEFRRADAGRLVTNYDGYTHTTATSGGAVMRVRCPLKPEVNWRVTLRREPSDSRVHVFSSMVSPGQGYYALLLTPSRPLSEPRIRLSGSCGTKLSLPTRFGSVPAEGSVWVVGQYRHPGLLHASLADSVGRVVKVNARLSGVQRPERENPAGKLWADRRIDLLQNSPRRDWRPEIIRLSQRFTVVSQYTALLAIPAEELARYQKEQAQRQVQTNTQWTGGGGGDPEISLRAPADTLQVVAVFPTGDTRNLEYDAVTGLWSGRFDIPFGTASGEYRVTVIVVHHNGSRSRYLLVYQNLLSTAAIVQSTTLQASPGGTVQLTVSGSGIQRAVAVAPWGERAAMTSGPEGWQAALTVPQDWHHGRSSITVVLLDGAHNRTEITVDLVMR